LLGYKYQLLSLGGFEKIDPLYSIEVVK